jgi:hypothetical protein
MQSHGRSSCCSSWDLLPTAATHVRVRAGSVYTSITATSAGADAPRLKHRPELLHGLDDGLVVIAAPLEVAVSLPLHPHTRDDVTLAAHSSVRGVAATVPSRRSR